VLGRLYPKLYSSYNKAKLVCDACEFAKHTRIIYLFLVIEVSLILILFILMFGGLQELLLLLARDGLLPLLIVIVGCLGCTY
jgi:hypothetical protein